MTHETMSGWTWSNGTSLQGYVATTAGTLTRVFGEPSEGCDKTWNQWTIRFPGGSIATIYDWKLYDPLPINQLYSWHIGGHHDGVVAMVRDALVEAGVPQPEAKRFEWYEPFTGAVA